MKVICVTAKWNSTWNSKYDNRELVIEKRERNFESLSGRKVAETYFSGVNKFCNRGMNYFGMNEQNF